MAALRPPFRLPTSLNPTAGVALAGTVAGTATVAGDLSVTTNLVELYGTSDGVATTVGDLTTLAALDGTSDGTATVTGDLLLTILLFSSPSGTATVTGYLEGTIFLGGVSAGTSTASGTLALNNMFAASNGVASVSGELSVISSAPLVGFDIPYPFLGTGRSVDQLAGVTKGRATAMSTLSVTVVPTASASGSATVTGTLFTAAGPAWMTATPIGAATVTGWLLNAADANVVELAGTSDGVATVDNSYILWWGAVDPVAQKRYLYLLGDIGASFDPTDDDSGDSRFVSQTFEDGDVTEFTRYLYLLNDLGVSFDPTDDDSADSRFVSQVFEDGHTRDDWSRYLYLLSNVLEAEPVAYGNLTVGPGYRGQETPMPARTPPSQRF